MHLIGVQSNVSPGKETARAHVTSGGSMLIIRARVPEPLAEAARSRAGLPEGAPLASVVRWALATAAGWPAPAARAVAAPRPAPADGRQG